MRKTLVEIKIASSIEIEKYSSKVCEEYILPDENDPSDIKHNMTEREKEIYRDAFNTGFFMGASHIIEDIFQRDDLEIE